MMQRGERRCTAARTARQGDVELRLQPDQTQSAPGPRGHHGGDRLRDGALARPRRRRPHGAPAQPQGRGASWTLLGASRGEAGILGEGIRQALLRDPTYAPRSSARRRCWSPEAGGPRHRRSRGRGGRAPPSGHRARGAHRRLHSAGGLRARRRGAARLVGRLGLVHRRALRAAGPRALELPDGQGGAARPRRRRGGAPDAGRARPRGGGRRLRARAPGGLRRGAPGAST